MQQFFVSDLSTCTLNQEQLRQVKQVLRMRKGDKVRLVDNNGVGMICRFEDDSLETLKPVEEIHWPAKKHRIRIVASLIRSERLEWMIQKACECGVDEIVLYRATRSVVRDFGKREERKLERFNLIALEASEQSYRQYPVQVKGILDKKDLKSVLSTTNIYGDTQDHPYVLDYITADSGDISVFIGPEGGFDDLERQHFETIGVQAVSFGPYIYRAETAPLAVSTLISTLEMK